jgi:hypothetical protein
MGPSSGSDLPAPSPDVVSRRVGNETVLVHLRTNQIFALNETGARFWELLTEGKSRAEVEQQLQEEYEVSREDLARELEALLLRLEGERLVQANADPGR